MKPRLRARTHHDYSYVVEQYIKPELGRFKLSALRANNVRKSYNQLAERGLGSQVIRQAHAVLHTALERARKDKLIAVNPATTAKEDALPRREKKEREWLKPNHARRFLEAAAGDRFGALWHLMITGGLRPAEGLGLKWQDIEGEGVHVRRSLIERGAEEMHFAEPKTERSRRYVTLPASTMAALDAHRKKQVKERLKAGDKWECKDLIFATRTGGPLQQRNVRRNFKRVLKTAELPPMRIYDLRHTTASLLLASGENIKTISERLGHSDVSLTLSVYSHLLNTAQRSAADKMETIVSGPP